MGGVRVTRSSGPNRGRLTRFQFRHLLVNDALSIRDTQNLDFILTRIDRRTYEWLQLKNALGLGVDGDPYPPLT